jgi:hypothetical protein
MTMTVAKRRRRGKGKSKAQRNAVLTDAMLVRILRHGVTAVLADGTETTRDPSPALLRAALRRIRLLEREGEVGKAKSVRMAVLLDKVLNRVLKRGQEFVLPDGSTRFGQASGAMMGVIVSRLGAVARGTGVSVPEDIIDPATRARWRLEQGGRRSAELAQEVREELAAEGHRRLVAEADRRLRNAKSDR